MPSINFDFDASELIQAMEKATKQYPASAEKVLKKEAKNIAIKRTYALEEKMSVHEEQIKVANHRIEDLERKGE